MKKVSIFSASFLSAIAFATVMFFNACTSDPCKDIVCMNGGTCISGTCDCATGYEGTDCADEQRTKFLATYKLSGPVNCDVTGNTVLADVVTTITASSSNVSKIVINLGGAFSITATVTGSSFTVDAQNVSGFDYSGSGSLSGTTLSLTLNEFDASIPETCIYSLSGPKQ